MNETRAFLESIGPTTSEPGASGLAVPVLERVT
jgi:hypothetical protein